MLEPGRVLGGRYEIVEEIGTGGMAIVYKAKDYKLRRMVALKVLKHEYSEDEAVLGKFRKEALSAGSLTHPNIVAVYDLGQHQDIDYIVMEYIDGITLKEYIKRRDMLSSDEVLKIAIKIAEALKVAHTNGIIHRDIKPQNIMVTPQGDVKVTDFGIAKAATSSTITKQGEALGSVHYFSPEQARGSFVDSRSDLYSLGITMYEMATKHLPFTGDTPVAVAMHHLHEPLPDPQKLAPQLWPGIRDIIIKLTQKRPDLRYQTADELIQDMKRIYKNHAYRIGGKETEETVRYDYTKRSQPAAKSKEAQERERRQLIAQREERRRQQKRRKNMIITGAVMGIVLLLALVAILKLALSAGTDPNNSSLQESSLLQQESSMVQESSQEESSAEYEKMPEVTGLSYEKAKEEMNGRNINYTIEEKNDDQIEVGYIIDQEPKAGTELKDDVKVVLYVSIGPGRVKVPNIMNHSKEDAKTMLEDAGLAMGEVSFDYNSTYPEGYVINQGTDADTEVERGTKIDVTVSLGTQESSNTGSNGGTIVITQPFANADGSGKLVVQAYDSNGSAAKIYDNQVYYSTFDILGGAMKVNYPAGTVKVEAFMDDELILSEDVNG